jgi:hypothetical protein
MSKLAEVQWFPADAASEFCDIGGVRLYRFTDPPRCSVAIDDVWVCAIFNSPEAALTWNPNWDEAEVTFRKINVARTVNKTIFLGPRGETPMTTEHQIAILTEAINKLAEAVEKLDVELRGRTQSTVDMAGIPWTQHKVSAGFIRSRGGTVPCPTGETPDAQRFQNFIPGGTK